ncbi:Glycoside hydrolase family 61 [Botryosphaeria dothidea]|uniref:AA9 family lytic polysaccharide monooxygenase n=1 Tax=Botryosphaeria dothidea TaxID=55169 RepID=A0A8H4J1G4_9PEZI|nr:Glycoside hydrolase family 61 [Botryosphaeria dothidea]
MKFSCIAIAAITPLASAHYFFDVLVVDGQETQSMQYVRSNTCEAKYNPTKWKNTRDDMTPDLDDFRCNKGAFTFAGSTGIAEVKAGSKFAMKLAVGATMQHPGPALVYMSKAPSSASDYEGDGEWFKIYEESVCNQSGDFTKDAWCTWDKDRIEFALPADLPDGEYLIRPEHIGVHGAHAGEAEFYYGCAQVKVTGGGNGVPGPTVKFPGAYKSTDESFNFSIWGGYKEYPMPGPAVWTGGSIGSRITESNTTGSSSSSSSNFNTTIDSVNITNTSTTGSNSGQFTGICTASRLPRVSRIFKESIREGQL